ncbi:MAG: flagellar hook-associated protein FlgL [Tepidanaerobacteraceae bacterium]|jgi:flagellar hook-associated protein 3 FlgL|nr:flagellar hook-associated protein FlgL [Tepidanaerobacteraceae bacterium]
MRITQVMINEAFMRNLTNNLKRMSDREDMLSSTKRVRKPSDDPVSAVLAMRLRNTLSGIEQYTKNVNDALTWLKSTETALTNTNDILQRIRELTVKASNGTLTADDRQTILDEISQLKEQLVQEANASYNNRYLFGGYITDEKPFEMVDGKIVSNTKLSLPYSVSVITSGGTGITKAEQINVNSLGSSVKVGVYSIVVTNYDSAANTADIEILDAEGNTVAKSAGVSTNSDNQTISGEISGTPDSSWDFVLDLSSYPIAGNGTGEIKLTAGSIKYNLGLSNDMDVNIIGTDFFAKIFSTIESIETDINNDDATALSNRLADIDGNISDALKYLSQVGAKTNRLENTKSRLDTNYTDYTELLSNTEDVDIAKTIMELKMDENVYMASLAVGAKIIQPTLVDFLS